MPDTVWQRFNFSWVAFFALMGLLNLVVVYFARDYWVGFHTFGRRDCHSHSCRPGRSITSASTSSRAGGDKPGA